jgi:tRNA A-37 threonylcarbamoyl transferase component Bud32
VLWAPTKAGEHNPMPKKKAQIGSIVAERFRLVKLLGEGSVGEVYLGEHNVLGRRYAIKLLKEQFHTDANLMERFRREALVASRLDHPNIVYISDFGSTPDGRFYLAMEYIDGRSLDELIDELHPNVPALRRALSILTQVASALTAAHDASIVHRDLKPENIMLRQKSSGDDEIKVLDFGLAKIMVDTGVFQLTGVGEIFGTPMFMSPEQARGEKVDERTDIYSFGVLAFELFTGRPPFECNSLEALIIANQKEIPPPPSRLRPTTAVPLPPELDRLVARCLEKDREKRPADMAEVMAVLELGSKRAQRPTHPYAAPVGDAVAPASYPLGGDAKGAAVGGLARTLPSALAVDDVLRLSEEEPWQWRQVGKRARTMAQWLLEAGAAHTELEALVEELDGLAQQVANLQTELAFPEARLEELEQSHRDRTAQLRLAVIDLSLERSRLADDAQTDQTPLNDLNFQIRSLEERLAEEFSTGNSQGAGVAEEVHDLERRRDAVEADLTACELRLVALLRANKPAEPTPEQAAAYVELEHLLRGG